MIEVIASGVLLGLSTGLFCLASCAPVFVPFMLSENRDGRRNLLVVGELAAGRLVAYLLVGAAVGIFAIQADRALLHRAAGLAMVLISCVLLVFIATKQPAGTGLCRLIPADKARMPVLFGFLTGINVCPPFLLAISYAAGLGSVGASVLLFFGFFAGTSAYLLLLLPLGLAGRSESFRTIGQITAVLSAVLFLALGILYLV